MLSMMVSMQVIIWIGILPHWTLGSYEYFKDDPQLRGFPHDIPENVTKIYIKKATITEVDYFEEFADLKRLFIMLSDLHVFPNLVNVSGHLTKLHLGHNKLSMIPADLLDQLTALTALYLVDNPLDVIPDVAGPPLTYLDIAYTYFSDIPRFPLIGRTIKNLQMYGCPRLTSVALTNLALMKSLRGMLLFNNFNLRQIPNLCLLNRTSASTTLTLNLAKVILDCGPDYFWLKIAVGTGHIKIDSDRVPNCQNTEGDIFEWTDNETRANSVSALFTKLTDLSLLHCHPKIDLTVSPADRLSCSLLCLKRPGCVMFALDGDSCTLTGTNPGTLGEFMTHTNWYIRTQ